jgi:predicted small integral membrane protein
MQQWSQTHLDLSKVASPFDGVEIYAARTSETHVEVVVSYSRGRIAKELFATLGDDSGKAFANAGYPDMTMVAGELGRSACGHLRVPLEIAPAAQPLPDIATAAHSKRSRLAVMRANFEVPSPAVSVTSATALVNLTPLTDWESGPAGERSRFGVLSDFQTRPLRINLGLTQSSANQGSWLSVSYRWDGPANLVRVVRLTDEQGGDQLVSVSD